MKNFSLLLLFLFAIRTNSLCLGVPLKIYGAPSFNCKSLCCNNGFVQDLKTGINCVSCGSVGLVGCAKCGLYALDSNGTSYTYKCFESENIPSLVTRGDVSVCSNLGLINNWYALNNYTNFNSCTLCSQMIPNSRTCGY